MIPRLSHGMWDTQLFYPMIMRGVPGFAKRLYRQRSKARGSRCCRCRHVFYIGWFGDPIFLGHNYPAVMQEHLGNRLPEFTPSERELLKQKGPINAFYGMDHYSNDVRPQPFPKPGSR
ncbi:hypothetical protein BDW59DRAFT_135934 [Aspergillus cavernicola]|uniref:Uncharacterized protein n=1 Tax=Aspergillus cavernicola TaxID=176166 RepID=A0ABR4HMR7_9EURO